MGGEGSVEGSGQSLRVAGMGGVAGCLVSWWAEGGMKGSIAGV